MSKYKYITCLLKTTIDHLKAVDGVHCNHCYTLVAWKVVKEQSV